MFPNADRDSLAIYFLASQEAQRQRDEMNTWTTTRPTEPGWYWAMPASGEPEAIFLQETKWPGYSTWNIYSISFGKAHWSDFSHWLGPLPVPEPPKE